MLRKGVLFQGTVPEHFAEMFLTQDDIFMGIFPGIQENLTKFEERGVNKGVEKLLIIVEQIDDNLVCSQLS